MCFAWHISVFLFLVSSVFSFLIYFFILSLSFSTYFVGFFFVIVVLIVLGLGFSSCLKELCITYIVLFTVFERLPRMFLRIFLFTFLFAFLSL